MAGFPPWFAGRWRVPVKVRRYSLDVLLAEIDA
jgi:hypothetical protein